MLLKKILTFFEIGSKQVFAQLNQSPWYRSVNEDWPRRSTSVNGPVMTSFSGSCQMNDLKMDYTVSNLNSQGK